MISLESYSKRDCAKHNTRNVRLHISSAATNILMSVLICQISRNAVWLIINWLIIILQAGVTVPKSLRLVSKVSPDQNPIENHRSLDFCFISISYRVSCCRPRRACSEHILRDYSAETYQWPSASPPPTPPNCCRGRIPIRWWSNHSAKTIYCVCDYFCNR